MNSLHFKRSHSGGRGRDEVTIHGHTGYLSLCVENWIDANSVALSCAHVQRGEVRTLIGWLEKWEKEQRDE